MEFIAHFAYKKDGFTKKFEADNKEEAWDKANEYQNNDNKGEPKSERIRLQKLTLNPTQQ